MPAHRKKRRSFDVPGDAHFLTFSCYKRLPLLSRDHSRGWVLDALQLARSRGRFHLWAYVVMPEHVHLVVLPMGETTVAQILSTVKQSVAKRAVPWVRENAPEFLATLEDRQPSGSVAHRFWQRGGGYDRNLRTPREVHEKIAYVHDNPVRRGLAARATQWEWSSALAWSTGGDKPIAIDRESVPTLTLLDERADGPLMRRAD